VAEPHYSRVIEENIFKLQKFIINVNQNVPKDNLYRILFSRMILDGIAGIQFLFGKFSHFSAILKAHYSFTSFFNDIQKEPFSENKILYNIKSIVYYINSGKIFTR
jgi:hypothetical protein